MTRWKKKPEKPHYCEQCNYLLVVGQVFMHCKNPRCRLWLRGIRIPLR